MVDLGVLITELVLHLILESIKWRKEKKVFVCYLYINSLICGFDFFFIIKIDKMEYRDIWKKNK